VPAPFPPTWAPDHRDRSCGSTPIIGSSDWRGREARKHRAGLLVDFSQCVGKRQPVSGDYNGRAFDLPDVGCARCATGSVALVTTASARALSLHEDGHLDLCDCWPIHADPLGAASTRWPADRPARKIGVDG